MKHHLSTCSSPGVRLAFVILVTLPPVLTGTVLAAGPTEVTSETGAWAEVRQFDVVPVLRPMALLAPNAQTPPAPAALEPAQRLQILAALDGSDTKASVSAAAAETFVLSAALTVYEDRGVLTLVDPYTVHPETGVHMRGSDPGSVGVKVRVEKGSRYLLDFLVKSAVPGQYELDTAGGSQVIEDIDGTREHVLLVLNAGSSGWTTVRLRRPDSDYFLYGVEVTRFE